MDKEHLEDGRIVLVLAVSSDSADHHLCLTWKSRELLVAVPGFMGLVATKIDPDDMPWEFSRKVFL